MKIYINSILFNKSLVDGPGIRTVLFVQGCDLHCPGCQNQSSWDITKGEEIEVSELAEIIRNNCINKKLTISGGEPLMQKDAVLELLKLLKDFDLTLYTGHIREEVPTEMIEYLTYLKTGSFKQELRTSITPFVGSTNQIFEKVK